MSIRSGAKAIIIKDGKILMNLCRHEDGGEYYDLPGGGQRQYEALEDAVTREVMEETGYSCRVVRFAALAEDIYTDPCIRERYPEYAHRMMHIFMAELTDDEKKAPTELDRDMEKSVWLTLDQLKAAKEAYPQRLGERIDDIINGSGGIWLGTAYK